MRKSLKVELISTKFVHEQFQLENFCNESILSEVFVEIFSASPKFCVRKFWATELINRSCHNFRRREWKNLRARIILPNLSGANGNNFVRVWNFPANFHKFQNWFSNKLFIVSNYSSSNTNPTLTTSSLAQEQDVRRSKTRGCQS